MPLSGYDYSNYIHGSVMIKVSFVFQHHCARLTVDQITRFNIQHVSR